MQALDSPSSTAPRAVIDLVDAPAAAAAFPGLYALSLPEACFLGALQMWCLAAFLQMRLESSCFAHTLLSILQRSPSGPCSCGCTDGLVGPSTKVFGKASSTCEMLLCYGHMV